ncbi:hypothetical protein Pyn_29405 [Prunus yedoensis var. nudiflora]|uniref:Uncharacterized protein n=1 Tax=Prunus yedoensis var. nudiflora TaxID=2094558 RepID=A0A314XLU4_PRUYE|nr:hypothetical protein Pyn_29405 [Prunus yedoensis var. nudiflora]
MAPNNQKLHYAIPSTKTVSTPRHILPKVTLCVTAMGRSPIPDTGGAIMAGHLNGEVASRMIMAKAASGSTNEDPIQTQKQVKRLRT